jgi:hypothetical protein
VGDEVVFAGSGGLGLLGGTAGSAAGSSVLGTTSIDSGFPRLGSVAVGGSSLLGAVAVAVGGSSLLGAGAVAVAVRGSSLLGAGATVARSPSAVCWLASGGGEADVLAGERAIASAVDGTAAGVVDGVDGAVEIVVGRSAGGIGSARSGPHAAAVTPVSNTTAAARATNLLTPHSLEMIARRGRAGVARGNG